MLGLTAQEKVRLKPQYHEAEDAFARRLHHDSTGIYENAYSRIKSEMGLPLVFVQNQPNHGGVSSVSTLGMFSTVKQEEKNRHEYPNSCKSIKLSVTAAV